MCFAPQRRALFRDLNFQKWSEPLVFLTFWLRNVLRATTACTFSRSEFPKVVRTSSVFNILTSKCASRHNGVHFFDICVHFDLEMGFAPQRCALFRHLNFQKWSENGVFCTFSLRNVLRATTSCTSSTSQLPEVVRSWGVLYVLTWKCASPNNGVQFVISYLASWLCTRRFSDPTFRPSGAPNHWKNTVSRDFPTLSRICIFFLLTLLSSTLLSSNLSLLSASSLLCFSSVHAGSLTSKLPSTSIHIWWRPPEFEGRETGRSFFKCNHKLLHFPSNPHGASSPPLTTSLWAPKSRTMCVIPTYRVKNCRVEYLGYSNCETITWMNYERKSMSHRHRKHGRDRG